MSESSNFPSIKRAKNFWLDGHFFSDKVEIRDVDRKHARFFGSVKGLGIIKKFKVLGDDIPVVHLDKLKEERLSRSKRFKSLDKALLYRAMKLLETGKNLQTVMCLLVAFREEMLEDAEADSK